MPDIKTARVSPAGVVAFGVGKTKTKRRNAKGIAAADTNAARAQITPNGLPAYALTRPLLNAHPATVIQMRAKRRLTAWPGFFRQTTTPRKTFAPAVSRRTMNLS